MVGRHEAVPAADLVEPVAEPALLDLDDSMAARAGEVMMVRVAAQAVTELGAVMRERVDDALLAEQRERPVDRREAGARVALPKPSPQSLRGDVVLLTGELRQHLEALFRHAEALLREERGVVAARLQC